MQEEKTLVHGEHVDEKGRFLPATRWSPEERNRLEKRLLRKVDLRMS